MVLDLQKGEGRDKKSREKSKTTDGEIVIL